MFQNIVLAVSAIFIGIAIGINIGIWLCKDDKKIEFIIKDDLSSIKSINMSVNGKPVDFVKKENL